MKLRSYLEKQLKKALQHQDKHPLSGSASREVNECIRALAEYDREVEIFKEGNEK